MDSAFRITDGLEEIPAIQLVPCHHKPGSFLFISIKLFHQAVAAIDSKSTGSTVLFELFSLCISKTALADCTACGLDRIIHNLNIVIRHIIIRIHKCQILTFCHIDASISGTGKPPVLLMDYLDPFLFFCIIFTDLRALIRRPIIHQDDFQILIGLRKQTVHTTGKIAFHPVHRYYDAD